MTCRPGKDASEKRRTLGKNEMMAHVGRDGPSGRSMKAFQRGNAKK